VRRRDGTTTEAVRGEGIVMYGTVDRNPQEKGPIRGQEAVFVVKREETTPERNTCVLWDCSTTP
jgi:hypothetical protein